MSECQAFSGRTVPSFTEATEAKGATDALGSDEGEYPYSAASHIPRQACALGPLSSRTVGQQQKRMLLSRYPRQNSLQHEACGGAACAAQAKVVSGSVLKE